MLLSPQNYARQKSANIVKLYTTTKLHSGKLFTTTKLCNEKKLHTTTELYILTSYAMKRLHNRIVIIRQMKKVHYLHTKVYSSLMLGCKHLALSVAAESSSVAPNQRRTETGAGTQSPPRTDYPGPTREDFGFPRLGWSVPLSQSPNREGLPSPPLERLVAVIYTRVGGPRGPSASCV